MNSGEIHDLLKLLSMLFVVVLIMMSANQFGPSVLVLLMIVAITRLICCNGHGGGGMSLLDLGEYYNGTTGKAQFPGFDHTKSISGKIQDIVLRVVVTMVIIAFCVKSGIFQASNLNPGKMFM